MATESEAPAPSSTAPPSIPASFGGTERRDKFDNISPLDYRYNVDGQADFFSQRAYIAYQIRVELALVTVLNRRGVCPNEALAEIRATCQRVTARRVALHEETTGHDLRALVDCIREGVSDAAKPFVHMTATSYDIVDTANAKRYRDGVEKFFIPLLLKLEGVLIEIALREARTTQVGRTHGQHAVPITFGMTIASYIARLGNCIEHVRAATSQLVGKFSGAVGAYNAASLFFPDPEQFEIDVLAELGLTPAEHSTQIAPSEAMLRLLTEVNLVAGVLAQIGRDMRHLQRTEIGEVGEEFVSGQVGSSTMPQKRNPINFENVEGTWFILIGHLVTALMTQLSEHQRDLTGSIASRTFGEMFGYVAQAAKRLTKTMRKLKVDRANLQRNLAMQGGLIGSEALNLTLAALGHPDAHAKVQELTKRVLDKTYSSLFEAAARDSELADYTSRMTPVQLDMLRDPTLYIGRSVERTLAVAENWKARLGL